MSRLVVGVVVVALGLVLALIGNVFVGPDMHPIATGLIAIGLVTTGVALVERRMDQPRDDTRRKA